MSESQEQDDPVRPDPWEVDHSADPLVIRPTRSSQEQETPSLEDRVRLAAAWVKSGDPTKVMCVACGSLRDENDPPCTCLREALAQETP